jgi:two-component system, cell cycle sensor histidine kinase and response regulator CckA
MPAPLWKRSEIWGLGIALATLLVVLVLTYRDWSFFLSARKEANQTRATLDLLSEIFSDVQDLEIGQRGFLITGSLPYLAPYESGKAFLKNKLADLDTLTADDNVQRARVQRLEELLRLKVAELQHTVDLRRQQGFESARAVVQSGEGKALMERIRAETAQFRVYANGRLRRSEQESDRYRVRAATTAVGGSAGLFVLILIAAVLVRNRGEAREQALESVSASKREAERVRDLLETTLRSIGDAVIATDAEGRITFLNTVAEHLTGWDLTGKGQPIEEVFRIVNEQTREPVENPIDKVRRTGVVAGLANHTLLLARDGRQIAIDDSGAPIRDRDGSIVGFVLVFRDIGERRAAEKALRQSEARLGAMANAAPVLLWLAGPNGDVTFLNRQWSEFTGRSADADLLSAWTGALHPDDLPGFLKARQAAIGHARPHHTECRMRMANGEYRSVICAEAPRFSSDGALDGFVGACLDVTDLKQAQQSLELSERRFRSLVAGTSSMVWQADATGATVNPLPGWEEFTGQSFEQYRGVGGIAAIHPDDRDMVAAKWAHAIRAGQPFVVQFRLWSQASAEYRYVVGRGIPLTSSDGTVLEWIGAVTDITEQRRLEEKLRQAAKLESLGVLAGGIAHDFNNLLVGIMGNASLLQVSLSEPGQKEVAREIVDAGERAAVLTRQMLAYSGRGRFVVESADLAAEIRAIVPLIKSSIPKHVEVVLDLPEALPLVEIDRAQFQQVVMNLVINGAEAIAGTTGAVTVSASVGEFDSAALDDQFPNERLEPGRYVKTEVRDTGVGMDEGTLAKIFDPFFTTKFTGRGLGLAAVTGIVRSHKGAIHVTSAPGRGSIFQIYLPVSAAASGPLKAAIPAVSDQDASTVLIVDDEEIVRVLARRALLSAGFEVLLAVNGLDAITALETNRDKIALILLDLAMPVMGGEEALPRLRQIQSDVVVVASSGYSQVEAEERFGAAIDGFIQKPYSAQMLISAIREALRKSSNRARA